MAARTLSETFALWYPRKIDDSLFSFESFRQSDITVTFVGVEVLKNSLLTSTGLNTQHSLEHKLYFAKVYMVLLIQRVTILILIFHN